MPLSPLMFSSASSGGFSTVSDVPSGLLDGLLVLGPAVSVVPLELTVLSAMTLPLCFVGSLIGLVQSHEKGRKFRRAAFGAGALAAVGSFGFFITQIGVVDEVPVQEAAQVWVLEEHGVVVPDGLQDELVALEAVSATVEGVPVTVRLVDVGLESEGVPVFALVDEVTGERFGGVE